MKKICFVVERYDPIVGGTERLCQQIVESLFSEYEVAVITQPVKNRDKNSYKYKIFDCPYDQFHLMKEHFEIFNYDLVIFFADLHNSFLNSYNFNLNKKNICILNLDENTYSWQDRFPVATKNLKNFDKVVTFTKNGIANKYLEENNINNVYIPNFSRDVLLTVNDTDFISKLGLDKNKKTILYNAAYEDRKNQLFVLKQIKNSYQYLTKLKNYNWIFIGNQSDPNYLSKCVSYSNDYNLKNIKFLNSTNDFSKLDKIYQQVDCLLLASKAEGLPLVILEAMSAGKPIVATPVGGIKGVLGETGIGILSKVEFSLFELEKELEKQINYKNNFREIWKKDFNKDIVVEKYKELIKEII